jgi:hypothetical protein
MRLASEWRQTMQDEQFGRLWTAHHDAFSTGMDDGLRRISARLDTAWFKDPPFSRFISVLAAFAATTTALGTTLA